MKAVLISQGSARALDAIPSDLLEVIAVFEHISPGRISVPGLLNFGRVVARGFSPDSLIRRSRQRKVRYRVFFDSHSSLVYQSIAALEPDIIIVFSMSSLLPSSVFLIPKYGALNIHLSYLPEYRGPDPLFWQYLNFELSPGVTIHSIDAGEDSGKILAQARVEVLAGTSPDFLEKTLLETAGNTLLSLALQKILVGETECSESETRDTLGLLRARRLAPVERVSIIAWDSEFTPERAFHFFHFPKNPEMYIPNRPALSSLFTWTPKSFGLVVPGELEYVPPGSLLRVGKKFLLRVSGGFVEFERGFSLKMATATLGRRMMRL